MYIKGRIYNGEKAVSLINGVGKTGQLNEKESNWTTFSHHIKKKLSKWIKHLNLEHETIKFLEETIGNTLFDTGLSNFFFFGYVSSGKGNKRKKKKIGLYQTKNLCTVRETINKMKRLPTEWEKLLTNYISDKGLISKICKQLIQFNVKKTNTHFKNRQRT